MSSTSCGFDIKKQGDFPFTPTEKSPFILLSFNYYIESGYFRSSIDYPQPTSDKITNNMMYVDVQEQTNEPVCRIYYSNRPFQL